MKKSVSIVGGGTAGLFLAAFLNPDLFDITIFEKKKTLGRKFLVAGDGGFNLTHAENMDDFINRYTPNYFLEKALRQFINEDLRAWLLSIGIPTFVGSSKRVFPEKGIKPITVLKTIESYLLDKKVNFQFQKEFTGWTDSHQLIFNSEEVIASDITVFAVGGASWAITGSNGAWTDIFTSKGIKTTPFGAMNCAFQVDWLPTFTKKNAGKPLKNISISIDKQQQKGEVVITDFGLEGNAIYALSPKIQAALASKQEATVFIDFKPMLSIEVLLKKVKNANFNTTKTLKQVIKLSPPAIDLIKNHLSKEAFLDAPTLIHTIKKFPLQITAAAPINEAISTSGGLALDALDEHFELRKLKNHFCIGEMVDWVAPTGGYLIQGCAAMGVYLARHFNRDF